MRNKQGHQWSRQTFFTQEDQQLSGCIAFERSDKGRGVLISVCAYSRWHLEYKWLFMEKWDEISSYRDYKKQFISVQILLVRTSKTF